MSIIQIFICDGCNKEFRRYDNERNSVTLKIEPDKIHSNAYDQFDEFDSIKSICNECTKKLYTSVIDMFNKRRKGEELVK